MGALIVYVSLYPFEFRLAAQPGVWRRFLETTFHLTSRGDILSNVILFVPLGILGRLAERNRPSLPLSLAALMIAIAVQVAQIYLPSRDANLQDVGWNVAGYTIGLLVGTLLAHRFQAMEGGMVRRGDPFVILLVALWFGWQLSPFVPSLDLQLVKNSLKPVLYSPWQWHRLLYHTVLWLVLIRLLHELFPGKPLLGKLLPIAAGVFSMKLIIVNNLLSPHSLGGLLLAIAVWFSGLQRLRNRDSVLVLLLITAFLVSGLEPFRLRPQPEPLQWLPFYSFLQHLTLFNVAVLLEKLFLFGALIWIAQREGGSRRFAVTLAIVLAASVEALQTLFVGHTPEITDPLLATIMGAFDRAVSRSWSVPG